MILLPFLLFFALLFQTMAVPTVRMKVFQNLKVDIKYGSELKEGIVKCLENELGVSRESLSSELVNQFDIEVKQMYEYFPRRMKKISRNKNQVIRKSRVFFNKNIELVEAPEVVESPNVEVESPNVEVERPNVEGPNVGYLFII